MTQKPRTHIKLLTPLTPFVEKILNVLHALK